MSYQCLDVSIEDRIAHIVMKRPEKRNSMNKAFWDELPAIIDDIDSNTKANVIVLSSTGPHFTAGLDLNEFMTDNHPDQDEDAKRQVRITHGVAFYHFIQLMQDSFSCLEKARVPVIAAIQGGCIGGGVDLVTACDMRYATEDAFLTVFEINVGMTADVGTFPRLVKLIPEGIVREMAYTGRRMPAAEAKEVGLINRVFPDQETMLEEVMKIAQEIAAKPPLALYGCKRMITYARDHSTADGLDYISIWNASNLQPEEMLEAVTSRAEQRPGDFVNLPPMPKNINTFVLR